MVEARARMGLRRVEPLDDARHVDAEEAREGGEMRSFVTRGESDRLDRAVHPGAGQLPSLLGRAEHQLLGLADRAASHGAARRVYPRRPARRGPSDGPDRGFHRAEPRPRERAGGPPRREARGTVGLLVAPEIGFGRYILDAEGARAAAGQEGEILAWAAAVARALGCHVCVGHVRADARTGEMYNSQTTLNERGERIVVYDKTHLYFVDEKWAVESKTGFAQTSLSLKVMRTTTDRGGDDDGDGDDDGARRRREEIDDAKRSSPTRRNQTTTPSTARRVAVAVTNAICMDINPYRFEAPWHAHELARASVGSDLIVFSSAWTSAHPDDPSERKPRPSIRIRSSPTGSRGSNPCSARGTLRCSCAPTGSGWRMRFSSRGARA